MHIVYESTQGEYKLILSQCKYLDHCKTKVPNILTVDSLYKVTVFTWIDLTTMHLEKCLRETGLVLNVVEQ